MKNTAVMLAVLALSVSCSKVDKAEKNMNTMKEKTDQMAKTTEKMEANTVTLFLANRTKESEDTRNKKFEIIKDKKKDFGEKILASSIYFKSFEFQFWTGNKEYDNNFVRQVLIRDAASEFTKRISGLYDKIDIERMSPTDSGKRHSDELAFYALAATMHMNHHFQDLVVEEKSNVESISFYDVIKSALLKERSDNLTEAEDDLISGINKEIMIELIKARVDVLSGLALKNITDKRRMTFRQKLLGALHQFTNGKLGKIELPETFNKANGPTKKQTIKYLDAALKAKQFLAKLGVEKELEETLHSAFSELSLGDIADPDHNGIEVVDAGMTKVENDKQKMEIRNLIDLLLQ